MKFSMLRVFLTGILFFGDSWVLDVHSQEASLSRHVFLKEAQKAWQKFRASAKHFQGVINTINKTIPDNRVLMNRQNEFKQRDGCVLWLEQALLKEPVFEAGQLWVENPRYRFELRRPKADQAWVVTVVDSKLTKDTKDPSFEPSETVDYWCNLPLTIYKEDLPTIVDLPEFSMKEVRSVTWAGRPLVRLEFSYSRQGLSRKRPIWAKSGWILFDPQQHWLMREYDVLIERFQGQNEGIQGKAKGIYEYDEGRSFVGRLKRFVRTETYSNGDSVQSESEFEINEAGVPQREFTLSAFGFPEPMGMPQPSNPPYYLWFVGTGMGILLAATLIRRKWRKMSAA